MKKIKMSAAILLMVLCAVGCKTKNSEKSDAKMDNLNVKQIEFSGNYVSDEYAKRNEGYDWVAVSVTQRNDSTYHLSVRSRVDIKKPTCTFDVDAVQFNDSILKSSVDGKHIVFTFTNQQLRIDTENSEDKALLNYFCSGGGTLAGSYMKIKEPLDKKQIDPRVFQKTLSLQNFFFDISSTGEGSIQQLTMEVMGLASGNQKIKEEVDGKISNAEIEDLNSDGYPEVLIYTVSAGSGSYGNVIGYSVNKGKSLSRIAFPNITDNPQANKGYMGHDEFAIVETSLVQRFRVYKSGDTNSQPTGNIRQIQYKLVNGEASRKFVVDKIVEFPIQ